MRRCSNLLYHSRNKEGWAEPRLAAYVKKQQKKMADAKAADEAANGEKG